MMNEIIIGDDRPGTVGNCYCGGIATKASYNEAMQRDLNEIRQAGREGTSIIAWCYAFKPENNRFLFVGKARDEEGIARLMGEGRVIVRFDHAHYNPTKENEP